LIPVPKFNGVDPTSIHFSKHVISSTPFLCDSGHLFQCTSTKKKKGKKYLIHNDIFQFLSAFMNALDHETASETKLNFQRKGLCMGLYYKLFILYATDKDLFSKANSFRWFYLQLNRFFAHVQYSHSLKYKSKKQEEHCEQDVVFKSVRNGGRKHWGFDVDCMTGFLKSIQKYNSSDFYFDVFFLEQWLS